MGFYHNIKNFLVYAVVPVFFINSLLYGKELGKKTYKLKNFAGIDYSLPDEVHRPESLDALRNLIVNSRQEGMTPIVPLGALHSWSPVFKQKNGAAIDMSQLVIEPKLNDDGSVIASANMSIGALHDFLSTQGRALPYSPMAMTATLVGLTATGSHGSHFKEGHFYQLVKEFKLIDGLGRFVKIDQHGLWVYSDFLGAYELCQRGKELLQLTRKHLGCLGVIYELSLKTVPALDMEMNQTIEGEASVLADNLARFKEHFDSNYSADIMWFPRLEKMIMRSFNPSKEERIPFSKKDKRRKKVQSRSAKFAFRLITLMPHLAGFSSKLALNTFKPMKRVGASYKVGNYLPSEPGENSRLQDMEYALPYHFSEEVIKIIKANSKHYLNPLPIYLRRCGDIIYVEFLWLEGFKKGEKTARQLESDFVKKFSAMAMPHDGKKYFINPWKRKSREYTDKFHRLRHYLDPFDLFLTSYKKLYFF